MSTVALAKPVAKLNAEPCALMAVGNHNGELSDWQTSFQYGFKSFPFEVESAGNVADDFCIRFLALEILKLSLPIILLLAGTNPRLKDGD
ncbi:MAG: hypothetical protein L0154_29915 [Chloroflexi bacterium]|nr:hypothetical protein [Chloroflexota bacterium]